MTPFNQLRLPGREPTGESPEGEWWLLAKAVEHVQRELDAGRYQEEPDHEVHGILVQDPLDEGISGLGLIELVDAESGEAFLVEGSHWGAAAAAESRIQALARAGVRAVALSTNDDPYRVLHRHFRRSGTRR